MDRSDVISLITQTKEQDDHGVWRKTAVKKTVFCNVERVGQREFFEAGRNGLNPEFRFTLFFGDYNDEPVVEYKGKTYSVYRTFYTKNDKVELYVERKGGTNGIQSDDRPVSI